MPKRMKKDIVVIAQKGYSVLLKVDGKMLDIDCYTPVNLSNIFSVDVLEKCASLSTHLQDGNLIYFDEGTELLEDINAPVKIKPLKEEAAQHIIAHYDKVEKDSNQLDLGIKTNTDITDDTRECIQERVKISKEKILQPDKKFLKRAVATVRTSDETGAPSADRQNAMTAKELTMKVSMDVSPETFKQKQHMLKKSLEDNTSVDEARAKQEIKNIKE